MLATAVKRPKDGVEDFLSPYQIPPGILVQADAAARNIAVRKGADILWKQPGPGATQSLLKPNDSCDEDVDATRFYLLHGANVEVHHPGQFVLRDVPNGSLPTNVRAEFL
jgi:hypothetical protein